MLTVITGPMFSGKSSKLISMLLSNVIAGNQVIGFKPDIDNRYNSEKLIVSHTNDSFPAMSIPAESPGNATLFLESLDFTVDVIGFDEAQFFNHDKMLTTVEALLWQDKRVICAGLSQDYLGNSFGAMPGLLATADEVISLKAVCSKCKGIGIATRTYRKSDDGEQVVVGGVDKYEARCYSCWSQT